MEWILIYKQIEDQKYPGEFKSFPGSKTDKDEK